MGETLARKAVDSANLNVLRIALYQATGDETLATLPLAEVKIRGGLNTVLTVTPEYQDELKKRTLDFLRTRATTPRWTPLRRT